MKFEEALKAFKDRKVILAMIAVDNGSEHYYYGIIQEISADFIKMTCFDRKRLRKRRDVLFFNRRAFKLLYISVIGGGKE